MTPSSSRRILNSSLHTRKSLDEAKQLAGFGAAMYDPMPCNAVLFGDAECEDNRIWMRGHYTQIAMYASGSSWYVHLHLQLYAIM